MASSDDEVDSVPESVTTYYFIDDGELPVSFAVLPIQWTKTETGSDHNHINIQTLKLFLKGSVDNGLRTIYKQVVAWKFDLSCAIPRISVLTKEKNWMELEKPRKSYEEIIRTVMITLHCLHFIRRNKEVSAKSVWDYLGKTFISFEKRPSQNDLVDQIGLIGAAVKRDNLLSNCKFLLNFLQEKPRKKMLPDEDVQPAFIDDDEDGGIFEDVEEDESNDDDELFDSVCAFCDNGGVLLCCEGSCLRSFHATVEAGESFCDSLGYTCREVETMKNFFCKNCKYNQHQCFACGKLGSSDKFSGAEVFRCVNATCGFFYHPHCVAKLLHREDKVAAEELQKRIAAGENFTCPRHKCRVCKQVENKKQTELQFAVCRRCPTSYHRKCLPKEILFEGQEDDNTIARAWEDLLPNRILIYCLKHNIIHDIGTPSRDHIRFPDVGEKKTAIELKKRRQTSEFPTNEENILSKKSRLTSGESFSGNLFAKASKELPATVKKVKITNRSGISSESDSPRKMRADDASGKSFRENTKSASTEMERSATANSNKISMGDQLYELMKRKTGQPKLVKRNTAGTELDKPSAVKSVSKTLTNELPRLDADTESRLLALVNEAASSITLEDVRKKHEVPSTHACSSKNVVDKNITLGKVEATVEAIRTALKKLEENCSIEDAKAVCEPAALHQLYKWKSKLKVFLAPFLYGMRYTSYGRHFTKEEKLVEIVDILHLYVEPGDMIVDFCCGANDFSCLMKKKLEETGKKCSYKNYDFIQPKNDFNFEKRDWMSVCPQELPKRGSQLIMGLNPPFGVKAALANKFINKALEFEPKLLILIVPSETERLDKKNPPYDLVWEDRCLLSGKSFYLPGSVDEHDKQMDQWNVTAPPLYLWSRHDWSAKHKEIAQKHGHPYRQQIVSNLEKDIGESEIHDHPVEDQYHNVDASKLTNDTFMQNVRPDALTAMYDTSMQKKTLEQTNHDMVSDEGHEGRSPHDDCDKESQDSHGPGKSHSSETSRKTRQGQEKAEKVTSEKSLEGRQNYGKKPSGRDAYKGVPHPSPPRIDSRSSVENPSRSFEKTSHADMGQNCFPYLEPGISGSHMQQRRTTYGGTWAGIPGDLSSGYSMNNDESYLHEVDGFFAGGNMEGQSTRHMRDGTTSMGYRSSLTELQREADIHSQVHLYGQDPSFIQGNYMGGHDLGYGQMGLASSNPYGHLGSTLESSYPMNSMSAMQRYAPRLDELNHTSMSNFAPQPSMLNGNGIYDPRVPGPGYQADPMGFAPGPRYPYPHHSAGWLND